MEFFLSRRLERCSAKGARKYRVVFHTVAGCVLVKQNDCSVLSGTAVDLNYKLGTSPSHAGTYLPDRLLHTSYMRGGSVISLVYIHALFKFR